MADSFKGIKDQVRYTKFVIDGKLQNLWTPMGLDAIQEDLLDNIVNKAQRDANMDVLEDADVLTTNTVADADEISVPNDIVLIKDIIIFAATADLRGSPMESVGSYQALIERGTTLEGQPDTYYLNKRTPTASTTPIRTIQFDRTADSAYKIEIHYWTLPTDMTDDSDVPELFEGYQDLIVQRSRYRVAGYLRDNDGIATFLGLYQEELAKAQKLQRRFNSKSDRVRFNDLNQSWF
jgi:hypothetical protein